MHSNIWIGSRWTASDMPGGGYTLVAILQEDVVVLRYETVASEPNWAGTEGYALVDVLEDGILQDGGDQIYTLKDF